MVYAGLAAALGREVLANLTTTVAGDAGDPLLTAAILHWNAHHVPWTDGWWQFPIFHPIRDALALSEHLLGLSAISAPLDWLSGSPLFAYNVTALLTFVLSGAAMYLLVYRLTGSAPGAFIAGLAFGFAPYRISQLPHIQVLAAFWAPLALLGLHAFIETGRRRWLALYGVAWALQAAANGYALVYFSILVGLWVLWFVAARRRWRDLAWIAAATALAAIPLVPILLTYLAVHEYNGFARSIDEIRQYSADVAAVLCAPRALALWGNLRVACVPEGELFPGVALAALSVATLLAVLGILRPAPALPSPRWLTIVRRTLLAVAAVYAVVVFSVLAAGPWRVELPGFVVSASAVRRPLLLMLTALIAALALSPRVRASARRSSTAGFYLLAALATWLLALGPTMSVMGTSTGIPGPYTGLMLLPGVDGLRAPARFWLMTMTCLAIAAGFGVAQLLARRSGRAVAAAVVILGAAVAADGWVDRIHAAPAPPPAPDPARLAGRLVLELPIDPWRDIAAQWRAVTGGWRVVNGFSGFEPRHYAALTLASTHEQDPIFIPFRRGADLHVLVSRDAPRLVALVERQPGVVKTAENAWMLQYTLSQRADRPAAAGEALPIAALASGCAGRDTGLARDRDEGTRWICPPNPTQPQELRIELEQPATVGAFVLGMGRFLWEAPRSLIVETSLDGEQWDAGWSGSILTNIMDAGMRDPTSMRVIVELLPRQARYVRVRVERQDPGFHFTVAEAGVHRPAP